LHDGWFVRIDWLVCATFLFVASDARGAIAETYQCSIAAQSHTELISPRVKVQVVDPSSDVRIEDAITTRYLGGWTRGKIQTSNAKRVTFIWEVRGAELNRLTRSAALKPTFVYSLTIAAGGDAVLTVNDAQNRRVRSFRGSGVCDRSD
jgi:hypothetical protein